MARISIGAAAVEGFSVIRRHPLSVLLWGLVYVGVIAAGLALLAPTYLGMFAPLLAGAQSGAMTPPDPRALMGQMLQVQGMATLFNFALLLLRAIMFCAVFRAVLHPERSLFGFMRLGLAELYVAALLFAAGIVLAVGIIVFLIPVGIGVAVTASGHHWAAMAIIIAVAVLILIIALIYLALRFSLVGPMIVSDGQFHLGDAWALTRGHAGALFLVGLLLWLIMSVIESIVFGVVALIGGGLLAVVVGGPSGFQAFFQQTPPVMIAKLMPLLVVMGVLWVPIIGGGLAILGAPWARAYRDLTTVVSPGLAPDIEPAPAPPPSPAPAAAEAAV